MTIVGELVGQVSVVGATASLEGHVSVQSETLPTIDPRLLYATLDISTDAIDSATPRSSSSTQFVGFKVVMGGSEIAVGARSPGLQVALALGGGGTWSLAIPLGSSSPSTPSPISSVINYKAAPPGTATVDIYGVYRAPSGVILTIPLITSGIVHAADEDFTPGGRVIRLSGVGPWGRYDHAKITLLLPPGMGLDRGLHVVRRIALQAGVPASSIQLQSAGRVYKEIQWSELDWIERGNVVLEPAAQLLHFDSSGNLTNPPKTKTGGRYDHVFYLRDLVAGSLSSFLSARNDAPTTIEVTGVRQVTREDDCGIVTTAQVVETWAIYAPVTASFKQDGAGNLAALSAGPFSSSTLRLTRLLYTERQTQCGDLIAERTIEAGWFNPTASRYTLASDGTIGGYVPGVYIQDGGAVAGDGAQAYQWNGERFVTLRDEKRVHTYDVDGYLSQIETTLGGWIHRRAPIKNRTSTPGTSWETQGHVVGQEVLGNGEGVADRYESRVGVISELVKRNDTGDWVPRFPTLYTLGGGNYLRRTVESLRRTDDGFQLAKEVDIYEWNIRSATGDYWYDREEESDDSDQTLRKTGVEVTTYMGTSEGAHDEIYRHYDQDGKEVDGENRLGLEGYLPAAPKRSAATPDASLYVEGEESSTASLASRDESQEVEGACSDPNPRRPRWTQPVSSEFAESPGECQRIACTELRLLTALKARATLPAHFYVRPGQRALFRFPWAEIATHVKSVTHREGQRGDDPTLTDIAGDCYVV